MIRYLRGIWPQSSKQRKPALTTLDILTISLVKLNPHFGEPVNIWGFYQGMTVDSQIIVHIIRGYEQDVHLFLSLLLLGGYKKAGPQQHCGKYTKQKKDFIIIFKLIG